MTITEALAAGKTIMAKNSGTAEYMGPFNNRNSQIKHIFRVPINYQPGEFFLSTVDEEGSGYTLTSGARSQTLDLSIKKEKKTVWVNMYNSDGRISTGGSVWNSEELAKEYAVENGRYIGSYPVTVEI